MRDTIQSCRALYPKYQVVGRERYAMPHERPRVDSVRIDRPERGGIVSELKRKTSYDSSPSPIRPCFPTIDNVASIKRLCMMSNAFKPRNQSHDFLNPQWMPFTRAICSDPTSVDPPVEEPSTVPTTGTKKRQRYLRDVDRCSIIRRIDNGEKQATLAREFGVTRAAICHIKKNRDEIISRYESLLESAKQLERTTSRPDDTVRELTQTSARLLLTTLRDVTTSSRLFRTAADRLMLILLEEALATSSTVAYNFQTTTGEMFCGIKSARTSCCLAVGEKGLPLVDMYRHINPQGHFGRIELVTDQHDGHPMVDRLDLPPTPVDTNILLLSTSTATGQSICAALLALQQVGITSDTIHVVVLACTTVAVRQISAQFPGIRILTCAIETPSNDAPLVTTFRDFLERYDGMKQESSHAEDQRDPLTPDYYWP